MLCCLLNILLNRIQSGSIIYSCNYRFVRATGIHKVCSKFYEEIPNGLYLSWNGRIVLYYLQELDLNNRYVLCIARKKLKCELFLSVQMRTAGKYAGLIKIFGFAICTILL
jgi:hypothetical protein